MSRSVGEVVLRVPLRARDLERQRLRAAYDLHPIARAQVAQFDEHRRAGRRIHVARDDGRPWVAGGDPAREPTGPAVVAGRDQRAVAVEAEGLQRRVHADARDAQPVGGRQG
jgi:hypothetical protein